MSAEYLIAITTYRRPLALARLLDSLARVERIDEADLLVIDNDAAQTARSTVEPHALAARYLVEPSPGVVAARNRALSEFAEAYRALIFIDDDESVGPQWFRQMTEFAERSGADIVRAPVVPEFPPGSPNWAVHGGFFSRTPLRTGEVAAWAGTGNTLVTRAAWASSGYPRFDPRFGATGGEDVDFFRTMQDNGCTILALAEAVAYEEVTPERLSWRWLRQRMLRDGTIDVAIRRKHRQALVLPILRGIPKSIAHAALIVADLIRGRGLRGQSVRAILFEWGRLLGVAGVRITGYRSDEE